MPLIFISYSRKDIDAANHIADELRYRGADVFVDYQRLKAGENFPERLATEIKQSDAVVFLLSKHSATSDWVRDEIQYARHCRKKIIPVGLDATDIPSAVFFLMAVERVDFTRWLTDRQVEAAILKLVAALELPDLSKQGRLLEQAKQAMNEGKYSEAIELLRQIQQSAYGADLAVMEAVPRLLREAETALRERIYPPDLSAILPPPFEWCWIPSGNVTLKNFKGSHGKRAGGVFPVEAFSISKYPITYGQYKTFVDAQDGYQHLRWWEYSEPAQAWRKRDDTWATEYDADSNLPATRISLYDALAFCNWLCVQVGISASKISLPTERQWQRAAQGSDDREYPWGDRFDSNCCNSAEANYGRPTAVVLFACGSSPYDVMDMSGNVCEWTLSPLDDDANRYLQCGGHWSSNGNDVRCSSRYYSQPQFADRGYGFRVIYKH